MRRVVPACQWRIAILCLSVTLVIAGIWRYLWFSNERIEIPVSYSPDYYEDKSGYETQFRKDYDWTKVAPDVEYTFSTTDLPATYFQTTEQSAVTLRYQTAADIAIAQLDDSTAWKVCSDGVFDSYPTVSYGSIKGSLEQIKQDHTCTVTVKCWYWANPGDETDMRKVTVTKTFAVNESLADMFEHIFADIYAHPSQPVINIADGGMGTWVLRGKNHDSSRTMSAHSLGTAIDINPSTGSFYINGKWYGNAYNQEPMPTELWVQLPEIHDKYHVLYEDSPIVKIFKAYGWYWGGDWSSGKDPMHLAFLGDGSTARQTGMKNMREGGL